MHQLKITCLRPGMTPPSKAHPDDAGLDLTLVEVHPKREGIFFFDTGIAAEPPQGFYTELVPRSSIFKTDFIQVNSVGIIDPGYRGAIMMPMRYLGPGDGWEAAQALLGQRIGQLILRKLHPFEVHICPQLTPSLRGEQGFGSSGT